MPINVTTVYTKENLIKFNDYIARSKKVFWSIVTVWTVILLITYVIFNFKWGIHDPIVNALTYVYIGLDLFCIYNNFIHARLRVKKSKNLNAVIKLSFNEDSFQTEVESQEINETATLKYSVIKKIIKKKDTIYLLVSRFQGHIVDVSELDEEQLAQLKALLQTKVPAKKFKWK